MVIDAAKGIEARTRKLFEICRLRDIPIITFVNKMDRESREPLELLDEIEKVLALGVPAPMVWPIGKGRNLPWHLRSGSAPREPGRQDPNGLPVSGPGDPAFESLLEADELTGWREEIALVHDACGRFDFRAFREGALTPVYFGSALKNFGVRAILDALVSYAPPPLDRKAATRTVAASEPAMTGIIFKIQAKMTNHRDRIAFMRVALGRLTRA